MYTMTLFRLRIGIFCPATKPVRCGAKGLLVMCRHPRNSQQANNLARGEQSNGQSRADHRCPGTRWPE